RENGEILPEVMLDAIELEPGDTTEIDLLSAIPIKANKGQEYESDLQFRLKQATVWASNDLVVSSSQERGPQLGSIMKPIKAQRKSLKVDEAAGDYHIKGAAFEAVFDKTSGALSQLVYQGQEVITGDLLPNFVRRATENDRRGWK